MSFFENYVLTSVSTSDAGLTPVKFNKFKEFSTGITAASESANPSHSGVQEAISDFLDIGFNFTFDNVVYRRIVVCAAGWLALVNPTETSTTVVKTALLLSQSYDNHGINLTNSSTNVLLCPWFDRLENVSSVPTSDSNDAALRQRRGIDAPETNFNDTLFGVRYYRDKCSDGRRLIVRWNSLTTPLTANSTVLPTPVSAVVSFECVLYENGLIEYRYSPKAKNKKIFPQNSVSSQVAETATVGIFASGSNRFRDFSLNLGHRPERIPYKYGGSVFNSNFQDTGFNFSGSFVATTRNYSWTLRPDLNWPGLDNDGTILQFKPPQVRRKILPRLEIKKLDNNSNVYTMFDDKRSIPFGRSQVINYPSTLNRFFGGTGKNVIEQQNLLSSEGNELEVTGTINEHAVSEFLVNDQEFLHVPKPFCDNQQDYFGNNYFSASYFPQFDESLGQPLWAKKQLKLSFPVQSKVKMFETTSSIYYYNQGTKSWLVPQNSITRFVSGSSTGNSDIASISSSLFNKSPPEDSRGFNAIGIPVVSGSDTPDPTKGTDSTFGSLTGLGFGAIPPSAEIVTRALTEQIYPNSVFVNSRYKANNDETFSLPIDKPFLIEKIVFEIPVECGANWFNDITMVRSPISASLSSSGGSVYDLGGPALTISLMNQIQTNNTTKREIILSGTITHQFDNKKSLAFLNFPPLNTDHQLIPQGFLNYGTPSAVIKQSINGTFTGSVVVPTEAATCVGPTFIYDSRYNGTNAANRALLISLIQSQSIGLRQPDDFIKIVNVKPLGRATDLQISGRSVLGGDTGLIQKNVINNFFSTAITSPFYVTGSAFLELSASILAATGATMALTYLPIVSHFKSPYLVYPNDKLVLSISKCRPAIFSYAVGTRSIAFSGSTTHDVGLTTGSIDITIYGSVLRENKDVVITTNKLKSNVIYDVIGNDEVVDQFEVSAPGEFVGGMGDDFITGSMTNARGRVFSRFSSRTKSKPDTSAYELLANPSLVFRLVPWSESVGFTNISQHVDANERFFDSLMPNISECIKINGGQIYTTGNSSTGFMPAQGVSTNIGFVYFNSRLGLALANILPDEIWLRSYPFEPRYLNVKREIDVSKTFIIDFDVDGNPIDPIQARGLIPIIPRIGSLSDHIIVDVNLSTPNITSSLNSTEISKVLYGFGHNNTMDITFTSTVDRGTNKMFNFRSIGPQQTFGGVFNWYPSYGPITRGWRYGVHSGLPLYNKAYFRRNSFGQFRDMLEQKQYGKFLIVNDKKLPKTQTGVSDGIVKVKFINSLGDNTIPVNTFSQNLSNEATSSFPYFDGEIRNRPEINQNTLNSNVVFIE